MYGIFNIYMLLSSVCIVTNPMIIPGFDIIQPSKSPRYRVWSFDILDPRPISISNWIVKNKGTSTQRSSLCAQLYSAVRRGSVMVRRGSVMVRRG